MLLQLRFGSISERIRTSSIPKTVFLSSVRELPPDGFRRGTASSAASDGGPAAVYFRSCSSPSAAIPIRSMCSSTAPLSRFTRKPLGQKGHSVPVDWPLPRRADNEGCGTDRGGRFVDSVHLPFQGFELGECDVGRATFRHRLALTRSRGEGCNAAFGQRRCEDAGGGVQVVLCVSADQFQVFGKVTSHSRMPAPMRAAARLDSTVCSGNCNGASRCPMETSFCSNGIAAQDWSLLLRAPGSNPVHQVVWNGSEL